MVVFFLAEKILGYGSPVEKHIEGGGGILKKTLMGVAELGKNFALACSPVGLPNCQYHCAVTGLSL